MLSEPSLGLVLIALGSPSCLCQSPASCPLLYAAIVLFCQGFSLFTHRHLFPPFNLLCFSFNFTTYHPLIIVLFLLSSPLLRAPAWSCSSNSTTWTRLQLTCYFCPPCAISTLPLKLFALEPRWPSGLRRRFANATHRGTGVSNPRLCQGLSFACSRWSDVIGSSLRGRGEDSASR